MVLDGEGRFKWRNSSGGIYELTGFTMAYLHGKVPKSGDDSWRRLLCTSVSRMFLLCRKETWGLLEKMAEVSGTFFKI